MNLLDYLIVILLFMVIISTVNEQLFHIQSDISLVMFSLIIAIVIRIGANYTHIAPLHYLRERIATFEFEQYLMNGVLCFMLFAGASNVNLNKFRQNARAISLLALLTTMLSALFYGLIFYGVTQIFSIKMNLVTCVLLGCVVSPTDPIAATGILSKIGLSKNVCSVIENESLFNDGTGVTLFIFVQSLLLHSGESNFLILMAKEIVGALGVALIVSMILFQLIILTKNPITYILVSLLDVSLVYVLCEELGFSGVIASVVCGMYFSAAMDRLESRAAVIDPEELYHKFWEILEILLNGILFVMIGLMFLDLEFSKYVFLLVPLGIIANVLARAFGVYISSLLTGRRNIPGNYDIFEYVVLMTWSALKGGLSLALAISTEAFLPHYQFVIFMNITFVTIFFTVLVQGLTVKRVYYSLEKHKAQRVLKKRIQQ